VKAETPKRSAVVLLICKCFYNGDLVIQSFKNELENYKKKSFVDIYVDKKLEHIFRLTKFSEYVMLIKGLF